MLQYFCSSLTCKNVNISILTLPSSLNLRKNVCMPFEKLFCLPSEGWNSHADAGAFIQPHCEHVVQCFLISDWFFYSTAGKMYGKGEEEDLTRLVNIFIHFPSLLSSF